MAIGMAVGLLFLGRAKQSLASSNRSLAFLLCAFYPSFPVTVVDNRTHLQAFRHLWALAVENRCIVTADRDTGHICSVPIQVKLNDGQQLDLNTPHTVPHWQSIQSIRVVSDRYFCTDLRIVQSRAQRGVDYHLFKLRRRLGNSVCFHLYGRRV